MEGEASINIAKGIKEQAATKIAYKDYHKCSFEKEIIVTEHYVIRSRLHNIYSEREKKIALSPHDDKRYLIPNSTDTLAWGHYRIQSINEHAEGPSKKKIKLTI